MDWLLILGFIVEKDECFILENNLRQASSCDTECVTCKSASMKVIVYWLQK